MIKSVLRHMYLHVLNITMIRASSKENILIIQIFVYFNDK